MSDLSSFKTVLRKECDAIVNKNIALLEQAMNDMKEVIDDETKSSVGDKHETARAMAQLELEKLSGQYSEVLKQHELLEKIPYMTTGNTIKQGSLVNTDKGIFYICTGIGKVKIEEKLVYVISPASPLAQKLINNRVGQQVEMNGQTYKILEIS